MVQGVGFRWSAAREAGRLGVKGFVKNMPDGTVFVEAEGSLVQLESFVSWCRKGPRAGFVDSVSISEGPPAGHTEFRIVH